MSERSKSGRALKWAGGGLAAFVLLLAACLAFLQTDMAREKLAAILSSALSTDSDARVVFSKPEGLIPFHAHFERITVGDGAGTWLSAEKTDLRWSPLALLFARIEIGELAASEVRLERLPAGPPEGEDRESEPFSFPAKLPSVTLERLSIADLYLGEAVLGEAGSFELDGSFSSAHHERGITASLHLARKDGPETRMDARIGYQASDGRLDAKIDFHEAAGGWTAGVLGWRDAGAIDVSLDSSAPIEEWKGTLSGNVDGFGAINTDIFIKAGRGMEAGESTVFGIHGAYRPAAAQLSSSPAMRALQSGARFGIDASISELRTMTMEKAEFIGEDFHLQASGRIDLESLDMEGAFELEAAALERFEPLVGTPVAGKLSGRGTVSSNAPEGARGTLEVNLRDFKLDRVQSDKIEARLSVEPVPMSPASSGWGFKVVGNGSAEEMVFAAAEGFPERAFQWSFDMEIREKGPISIAALQVLGKSLSLELRGEVDPKDLTGTVDATVHAKDTEQLGALLGRDLPSEAKVGVHLTGNGRALDASAHIDGRLSGMEHFPGSIAPLLSPGVAIEGDVELLQGKELNISAVKVLNEVFHLDAEALMNLQAESMKGSWKLSLLKPAALGEALERDISGALEAKGEIEGPFTALRCNATLAGNEIVLDGRKLRRVGAELLAENIPAGPRGSFRLEVKQDGMDLTASTGLALDDHRLELAPLFVKAGENEIKGDLVLDLEKKLAAGSLEGRMDDLADFGRIIGEPLGGSARFKARLAHGKAGQGQDAEVSARAESLRTHLGTVKEAAFSADLHNIGETPRGDASLKLRHVEISGTVLDDFNLKGSAKGGTGKFEISARGRTAEEFDINAGGTFALSKDAERVRIETFGGHYGNYPLKLVEPAAFRRSGTDLSLEELSLSLGDASLKASGSLGPKLVRMDLDLRGLPLDMLASLGAPDFTGTAAGKLGLSGSPSNPSGRIQLSLTDVRKRTSALRDLPAATVNVEARLEGGRLDSTAKVEGILKEPATADLSIPLSLSFSPIGYELPPRGSVHGRLKATADLATLAPLLAREDHRASGNLQAGFNIGGTVADLDLEGGATISEGSYHNLTYGTVLKDVSARIVTRGDRLVLEELRATDGEKGRIRAEGWIELDASDSFPMALEANFSDAGLIRRDDVTGSLGGSLKIAGSFRDMAMPGKLTIGSADVLLPRRINQPMAELHVVEINMPEAKAEPPKPSRKPSREPSNTKIRMDLAVSSPGRVIVHGHNLNSEWKGDIRISGTTDKPTIVGALTLVRGQYTFLDKPFRLLEGAIQFYGSSPPRPTLRVVGESKAKDITARLLLTGPVSAPKVELESEPPLPSDEILSRILFGRSLSTVTPLQAGKLALAMRSLSGKGDTLDFLDRARKRLGIDQLELRDVQDGTALGIGKYLTEEVYVDVEKGLGNEPGKVSVQVELTPSIRLETEAGTDASKGIQLEWKYDY